MEVKSVEIKPEVIDPEDAEMLGDLVTAAVNEALRGRFPGEGGAHVRALRRG